MKRIIKKSFIESCVIVGILILMFLIVGAISFGLNYILNLFFSDEVASVLNSIIILLLTPFITCVFINSQLDNNKEKNT